MFRYSRHEIRLGELFQANQIRIAEEEGSSRFRHRQMLTGRVAYVGWPVVVHDVPDQEGHTRAYLERRGRAHRLIQGLQFTKKKVVRTPASSAVTSAPGRLPESGEAPQPSPNDNTGRSPRPARTWIRHSAPPCTTPVAITVRGYSH